jgi:hypothetical protein
MIILLWALSVVFTFIIGYSFGVCAPEVDARRYWKWMEHK